MSKYFLDTSFLIAFSLKSDTQHKKAVKYRDILVNEDCYINNSVINECINVVYSRTRDVNLANSMFFNLNDLFTTINEYEIKNYNIKTLDVFNTNNGSLGFTDSGIIVTMDYYGMEKLLTFDKQFKKVKKIEVITI